MKELPVEILLASQSPRRRELIFLLGYPVNTLAADADEESVMTPDPAQNVVDTAVLKTTIIMAHYTPPARSRTLLIAADTTVALDGEMLNKPRDAADARRMLRALRGRAHEVHTGYVIRDMLAEKEVRGVHTAVVTMRSYTDTDIDAYVATGDPLDKAGAYAIQHPGFRPVCQLDGCFLSVVGLPVCDLIQALGAWGMPWQGEVTAVARAHNHHPCTTLDMLRSG